MRRRILLLATASLVYGSQSVFSVHDDLLAFPQYEVVFSDTFISDTDAESLLTSAASSSSAQTKSTAETPVPDQDTAGELAQRHGSSSSDTRSQDPNFSDATDTYESMILHDKRYLCTIPRARSPPQNETSQPSTKADEERELARASDRGWELLKDMEGHCMYFISGWWSYSFCYNTQVKQFHQLPPSKGAPPYPPLEDPSTPSYILGQFIPPSSTSQPPSGTPNSLADSLPRHRPGSTSLQAKGSKRYLVQSLAGGSACDLTGRDRRVEIQFHCHPQSADRIGWIKEVATCTYVMVIYTPRLCNDVAFLPPRDSEAHNIACREVVPVDGIAAWEARKAHEARGWELGNEAGAARVTVAGIVVGAMQHVGTEGKRLAAPAAAAAGTTAAAPLEAGKTDLVAKMRPGEEGGRVQKVRDEELRKMGFEPDEVEGLLREIQEMAEGNGWRVELVDVGDGARELRGVVEVEEEEGGEGEGEGNEGSEEVYKDEL